MRATRSSLQRDLHQLGIRPGDLLMVHGSLRAVGPILGGVNVLIQALFDAIGPHGTLAAYVDFEPFWEEEDCIDRHPEVPVFDKRTAPAARDHGILHEALRTWPGALRSDHPDAGVLAIGPLAEEITATHPFQYGYGPGSPFEKIHQLDGHVAMIGAPLDTITMLHYAEHLADIPNKKLMRYRRLMPGDPDPRWIEFEEFDTTEPVHDALPENCFEQIALDFLKSGKGSKGRVGQGDAHLFDAKELVAYGVAWIERSVNRTEA
jgi:aminoglycoside 3-N-acetyltransferase